MKSHRQAWKAPKPNYTRGVLVKYAPQVTSAYLKDTRSPDASRLPVILDLREASLLN